MPRFEAHITVAREYAREVQTIADEVKDVWVFSQIDGCPLLGQGVYCYLTGYDQHAGVLLFRMHIMCEALAALNVPILRSKIERIVYDTKTNVNEIEED